jgi:Skp family chaperone for outer membrane proteins
MKFRAVVSICLAAAVILFLGYGYGRAEPKSDLAGMKVGVVSVQKILRDSKRSNKYREETIAGREKILAKLEQLTKEIEAEEAGLKVLKVGSSDYLASMEDLLRKRANREVQEEFYKQRRMVEEQRMIEAIYKDILQETVKVAEQKGLDIVFEKSEPELPAASANELTLTVSTHKLLYSGGCVDITEEVMTGVDGK